MNRFKMLDSGDLAALASPFRRQLLEELSDRADSAASIARRHDMSRQRVGYHMRELVKAGLLEVVEERAQRGLKEQLYRTRPLAFVHGPERLPPRDVHDRYSWAALVNLLARALWDLVRVRRAADAAKKRVATLAIETEVRFANPSDRAAFTEALAKSVASLVDAYQAPDASGRSFRLVVGAYPAIEEGRSTDEHPKPGS